MSTIPARAHHHQQEAGHNQLEELVFEESQRNGGLEYVDASMNKIIHVDVAHLPKLRSLNIDFNRVPEIKGLSEAEELSQVSWRSQTLEHDTNSAIIDFESCEDLQAMALSGNRLLKFESSVRFLGLQRLELVSTGLEELPERFGVTMPNLRILNLNHNALNDIRGLVGIQKLSQLFVYGNRLARLRRTMMVLSKLGQHLKVFDCRLNPLTHGFYGGPTQGAWDQLLLRRHERRGDEPAQEPAEPKDETTEPSFIVPDQDVDADEKYRQSLDNGTTLRRRIYELLALRGCQKLEVLDGLTVDEERILVADDAWEKLVQLGVVSKR